MDDDPPPVPIPPDEGHRGHQVRIDWIDRQGFSGVELGVAGFRHGLTDPLPGFDAGSAVTILDLAARFEKSGPATLERFDLLNVQSAIPSTRLFQQPAWALEAGVHRKPLGHDRALLGTLGYRYGRAWDLGPAVLDVTVGGSLDTGQDLRAGTGTELQSRAQLVRQGEDYSIVIYREDARYVLGDRHQRRDYGLTLGFPLARDLAVETTVRRDGSETSESEVSIGLRRFF